MPRARKLPKDYHALAESRGYKWLGPEVKSANDEYTYWLCPNGHRYRSTYSNFYQGYGCGECGIERAADARRKKPSDYRALAKSKGYKWLGPEVKTVNDLTFWECSNGHKWEAKYVDVYDNGVCYTCWKAEMGDSKRKKPADYHALADSRGYRWIGPEVKTAHQKTAWLCPNGHEWFGTYNNLSTSKGCPICGFVRTANKNRLTRKDYHDLASRKICFGVERKSNIILIIQHGCVESAGFSLKTVTPTLVVI